MPRARSLSELETLELHPAVTFVIGENGSGKSTLLEAIAVAWGFILRAARTIFASTLAHLILSVDYYETEHYSVTRNFLADPKRMLNILLEPDGPAPAPAKGETAL